MANISYKHGKPDSDEIMTYKANEMYNNLVPAECHQESFRDFIINRYKKSTTKWWRTM